MLVSTARRIIKEEQEFLGVNWADLEHMIQESSGPFPQRVLAAYKVVKEFNTPKILKEKVK
jgi:hypothetical protein